MTLEGSVLVPIGEGWVAWGTARFGRGRFLAKLTCGAYAEPELEVIAGPDLKADAELEMGTAGTERLLCCCTVHIQQRSHRLREHFSEFLR